MPAPLPFDRSCGTAAASRTHDLKNLLAVVLGVCESLSESLDPASEHGELARVGLLAAERAGRLAHQMHVEPPRPAALELAPPPTCCV
jgi:hypothetical protein